LKIRKLTGGFLLFFLPCIALGIYYLGLVAYEEEPEMKLRKNNGSGSEKAEYQEKDPFLKALLPENIINSERNFQRVGEREIFQRKNLYQYINGGAELYLRLGFLRLCTAEYLSFKGNTFIVDIYEMKDQSSAEKIYKKEGGGRPSNVKERNWKGLFEGGSLSFYKDQYYIKLTAFENKEEKDFIALANFFIFTIERKKQHEYPSR